MFRIGVIGTADIAKRKMIPAMKEMPGVEYVGVAIAKKDEWEQECSAEEYEELYVHKLEKAKGFVDIFGGKIYEGYLSLLEDENVDAVYIPLPPALHFRWAESALLHNKHVLSEKPLTLNLQDTQKLLHIAKSKNCVLLENYAFCYHKQFQEIIRMVSENQIGEVRLITAQFGFPFRGAGDFRYSKKMGGGALLDCGGYTIKAATAFMDRDVEVKTAVLAEGSDYDVDMYGSLTLQDGRGRVAQLSFGMDNQYRCLISVWGQKGEILATRFFTAPEGFEAPVTIQGENSKEETYRDNQFYNSLEQFIIYVKNGMPEIAFEELELQARLVNQVRIICEE